MKFYLSILIWLSLLVNGFSQDKVITGMVTAEGEILTGATLLITGTERGTTSDVNGKWTLMAKEGDEIQVNYLGYEDYRFTVDKQDYYEIDIVPNGLNIDEIVVTALGLKRESKALGYSIQSVGSQEISEIKSPNFVDNLTGKLAGVTISQGPTGVGSTSKIIIRGESSFTQNNPLFVVDGVPVNNNTTLNVTNELAAGFQEVDFGNGAMDLNPDDIESVSVLKGPGAAALYGTRASNGVIVITTKDGSESEGLGISFNSSFFIDRPFQLPEFQNRFGQGNAGNFAFVDGLGGGVNDNITYSYGPELDAGNDVPQYDSPVTLPNGQVVRGGDVAVHGGQSIPATPFVSNPNNLKNFYETGNTRINNLSFGGKYDRGHYRLSLTNLGSDSYIPGVNLNRNTISARMSFKPTKRFTINTAVNYVNSQSDNRPANGYGSENINYSLVAWLGRQTDLNPLKDYWQPGLENVQQYSFNYTFFDNPYFILLENRNAFDRDRVFGNITATYEINPRWSLSLRTGMDNSDELRTFRRAFSSNRFKNGAYAEHDVSFREINTDFLVNYNRSFGDFDVEVSGGGNRLDQKAGTTQTQAIGLAQPGIFKLSNAAAPLETFQFDFNKRINSLYAFAKFGFRDFLYVDVTGRNDWSSALATPVSSENASFFYPSVSGSLLLSKIIDLPRNISFAKIRASWAQVGNDTDPYQTVGVFAPQTPVGGLPTFSDQNFIANNNLLPEKVTSIELGADLRFLDDRLSIDFTYYQSKNDNQILSLPIAISTGYNQRVINGGSVESKGMEAVLGLNLIRSEKFNWSSFVNFSRNVSKVTSLPDEAGSLTLAYSRVYDNPNQTVYLIVRENGEIGDLWGTGYKKNENGDFIITDDGRLTVDNTLKKLGNYNPDFIIGMSNQLSYKNFQFNFLLDWRQGGQIVSRTQALAGVGGQLKETENRPAEGLIHEGVVNTGTEENPVYVTNTTAINPETFYRQFYDRNHEENNTYSATYLKVRQVGLTYRFRQKTLNGSFLKNFNELTVSIVGKNLFAFTAIPHFDPEQFAIQGNNLVSGVEDMSYPTARSFGISIGVKL